MDDMFPKGVFDRLPYRGIEIVPYVIDGLVIIPLTHQPPDLGGSGELA